jgi:hypothetical protein
MAESTIRWFIVSEKYCSLAEKVRLIRQANRALGLGSTIYTRKLYVVITYI